MSPFSKHYKPQIKLTPSARDVQISRLSKQQRDTFVLADAKNSIHVPTQAESDRSKRVAGRRINHI